MELNICLIGCGMIGKEHIERIQNRIRGAKVVAVCDVFEEGVKKGAKLKNCVIMQNCVIGENTKLDYVVADKNVTFADNRTMAGYQTYPVYVAKGGQV